MELIHIIQEIVKYIPIQYTNIIIIVNTILPMILIGISLVVCFLGYRLVKIWSKVYFFCIGFLIGSFSGIFFLSYSINIGVFIFIGLLLGILGAYFSGKLHKIQIFIFNFMSVYLVVPNILDTIINKEMSIIIGLIFAIIIAILSIKYKYPITVVTSSIHGGFFASTQIMQLFIYNNIYVIYITGIILSLLGIIIQFKIGKEQKKYEKKI